MHSGRVGVVFAGLTIAGTITAGCQRDVTSDSTPTSVSIAAPESATSTTSTTTSVAPPTVAPTTTPPASTTTVVHRCVESLSVREMAALVTWPAAVTADWDSARRAVGELGVGGVLLMEPGDDVTLDELAGLLAELDRTSAHGVLVATDEEGGTVQRLRQYRSLPSQRDVAATMSPDEAAELITGHGAFVSESGVDVVLGPVVDVAPEDGRPALDGSRFFSGSPDDVTAYAAAYVEGWSANGLLPTLKHFPGHGAASADTHDTLGVTPPLDELELRDLVPYRSLAAIAGESGAPVAVMVGHLDVPGFTATEPASVSSAAVELLRGEIGFGDALVISDALEMGAVDLPLPDAAVASIGAGVDVVLFSDTAATGAVIDAIVTAVQSGELPDDRLADAADRVLRSQRDRDCGSGNP